MYTKGSKKQKEAKEKKVNIKTSQLKDFASFYGYDINSVREALEFYPKELKKEIKEFEKIKSN